MRILQGRAKGSWARAHSGLVGGARPWSNLRRTCVKKHSSGKEKENLSPGVRTWPALLHATPHLHILATSFPPCADIGENLYRDCQAYHVIHIIFAAWCAHLKLPACRLSGNASAASLSVFLKISMLHASRISLTYSSLCSERGALLRWIGSWGLGPTH